MKQKSSFWSKDGTKSVLASLLSILIGLAVGASSADGINLAMAILGSILGGLVMAFAQFLDCVVDYTKKEYLQFEDDDYFYYVKAIPKIQVSRSERNVKTFKPAKLNGGEKKTKTKRSRKIRC